MLFLILYQCFTPRSTPDPHIEKFCSIATELQHEIWSYLDDPADRVILALTSKHHAATFEELKFSKQQAAATGLAPKTVPASKGKAKRKAEQSAEDEPAAKKAKGPGGRKIASVKRSTKQELIPFMQRLDDIMNPVDPQTRQVTEEKFRLCYTCLRYVSKSYRFEGANEFPGKGAWIGRRMPQITWKPKPKDYEQYKKEGWKCGRCVVRDTIQLSRDVEKNQQITKSLLG